MTICGVTQLQGHKIWRYRSSKGNGSTGKPSGRLGKLPRPPPFHARTSWNRQFRALFDRFGDRETVQMPMLGYREAATMSHLKASGDRDRWTALCRWRGSSTIGPGRQVPGLADHQPDDGATWPLTIGESSTRYRPPATTMPTGCQSSRGSTRITSTGGRWRSRTRFRLARAMAARPRHRRIRTHARRSVQVLRRRSGPSTWQPDRFHAPPTLCRLGTARICIVSHTARPVSDDLSDRRPDLFQHFSRGDEPSSQAVKIIFACRRPGSRSSTLRPSLYRPNRLEIALDYFRALAAPARPRGNK